ncbi:T9SS type A sorting domain-containing protein [Chryseolinea lacunae]|uniref:T9SS type A sorting domain-containing protein n=1 Tax=Chryseolinea lacunae TaxID=2801331 RepID=A0ABS1KNK2_9BACT|nr:T9SS type A sorting domain-containing protein [Chryseolinea lacunae]MBL0739821.1 T9SS type A sorting domain-containing protein [Chryseolinea lacunae]
MTKFNWKKLTFLVLALSMLAFHARAQSNIALSATPTTSFVSSWETLAAVKDGFTPANSNDKSHGAYGNWNNPNSLQWVQYDWTQNYLVTSVEVYWFNDGGGVLTPTTAYVEYWNGASWVNIGNVPLVTNAFNVATFASVSLNRIRITMRNTTQSTGILEWRVMGTPVSNCAGTAITAYTQVNGGSWTQTAAATLAAGGSVRFGPQPASGGSWSWTGPNGFTATTREILISNVQAIQAGTYVARYTNTCGTQTTQNLTVTLSGTSTGNPYTWPVYSPNISYNFRDEFPALQTPTQVLNDCPQVVSTQSSDWWCFRKGPTANSLVTSAAVTPMLARLNTDFAYFRDQMGWPPDLRAKNGYRSAVYLYGSGLCTDNEPNTALGGWQSAITYNGTSWPMVLASYYPVYSFDPACTYADRESQKGAMTHEGIHALLADLPGIKQSAWFHEGGNVWLQQTADARRTNNFSTMGDLNGTDFIAPFMPIECYSGWLQDGSFGGPSAEGVNMFNGNQQICTWRTYLGGHQYSSSFPTFLGNALGDGAVPWIWRNSPNRVLEGIASGIGATQIRRLITEYRAKQALVDFGPWNTAILALMNAHFGQSVTAEWQPSWMNPAAWSATPYVQTTNNSGTLTPEARTLPGWSGANQIPLLVTGNMVTVNFQPIGANMTCQLVYRTTTGTPVYSQYVSSGNCSLRLDAAPANNVVIAVITNTDYIYNGESTRTAHFDYRLQLVTGVTGTASINTKWFTSATLAGARSVQSEGEVGIDMSKYCTHSYHQTGEVAEVQKIINPAGFLMYPNPVAENKGITLEFINVDGEETSISIFTPQGRKVYETSTRGKNITVESKDIKRGYYIVKVKNTKSNTSQNLIVN